MHAKDLSVEDAAIMIQGAYRRKIARRRLHQIASKSYRKGFDPNTKRVFYYNLKTQKSFWKKPSTLPDDDDLKLTPRSEKLAIEARQLFHQNQRRRGLLLTHSVMRKLLYIFKAYGVHVKLESYFVK